MGEVSDVDTDPAAVEFFAQAAIVVPQPQNGSRTISPTF